MNHMKNSEYGESTFNNRGESIEKQGESRGIKGRLCLIFKIMAAFKLKYII